MEQRLSEFELSQLEKEARRMIVCTGCYGSGEDRWHEGRACQTCAGASTCIAEPQVLLLINEVRQWREKGKQS